MFYEQRVMDIPDGLPKWEKMQGESRLIEDSPMEMVEERKRQRTDNEKQEESKKPKHVGKKGQGANTI